MRILFLFFILFVGCLLKGHAQSNVLYKLEQQKKKTKREINKTNRLLKETSSNAQSSLQQLNIINEQIKLQGQLLDKLKIELDILTEQVELNRYVVDNLANDLTIINDSYAKMVQYARKNQNQNDQLYFLLSSKDFNQAYERFIHLKQLTSYRRKQSEAVSSVRFILDKKVNSLETQVEQKLEVHASKFAETLELEDQKQKQDLYYLSLQTREKSLKRTLSQQRRIADNLDNEIEKVIAEEARRKMEASESKLSEVDRALSDAFADNKGRLPWPVDNGVITDKFGEHAHPVLKKVMIKNSGVDIATSKGQNAKVIFNGKVSRVLAIPGANKVVIIRHGSYLTVYSNLSKVYVRPGETVTTGQALGRVFTNSAENNTTTLKFQVWKESSKQNPELWIRK